jgi:hypothetical protein
MYVVGTFGMRCLVVVNTTSNISEELPYLVQCHMNSCYLFTKTTWSYITDDYNVDA